MFDWTQPPGCDPFEFAIPPNSVLTLTFWEAQHKHDLENNNYVVHQTYKQHLRSRTTSLVIHHRESDNLLTGKYQPMILTVEAFYREVVKSPLGTHFGFRDYSKYVSFWGLDQAYRVRPALRYEQAADYRDDYDRGIIEDAIYKRVKEERRAISIGSLDPDWCHPLPDPWGEHVAKYRATMFVANAIRTENKETAFQIITDDLRDIARRFRVKMVGDIVNGSEVAAQGLTYPDPRDANVQTKDLRRALDVVLSRSGYDLSEPSPAHARAHGQHKDNIQVNKRHKKNKLATGNRHGKPDNLDARNRTRDHFKDVSLNHGQTVTESSSGFANRPSRTRLGNQNDHDDDDDEYKSEAIFPQIEKSDPGVSFGLGSKEENTGADGDEGNPKYPPCHRCVKYKKKGCLRIITLGEKCERCKRSRDKNVECVRYSEDEPCKENKKDGKPFYGKPKHASKAPGASKKKHQAEANNMSGVEFENEALERQSTPEAPAPTSSRQRLRTQSAIPAQSLPEVQPAPELQPSPEINATL